MNTSFHFWQKCLTYANVITVIVGILAAYFSNSFIFDMYNGYTKEVFFDSAEFNPEVMRLKNWLTGIIGATIVGFHVLMIMISENAFKKKEPWAYRAMWYGILSWFIIDGSVSIYYGAIYNIVMINLVALVLIGIPLIMTRKDFVST